MPVKCLTPGRAGVVLGTATIVMIINALVLLPGMDDCEKFHLDRMLNGPVAQDSRSLLKWIRNKMVPPSRHPYNLTNVMNGYDKDDEGNSAEFFSPSQEFILDSLQDIFGDAIETPQTFLECGAYDGEFLSNTLWLEREFGWRGILVEANPGFFHQLLQKHRKSWAINVCLNTKPYPSKEKFVMGSSTPENTNHLANGILGEKEPWLEKHISQGSSRLAEYRNNNNTQLQGMMEVQCVPVYSIVRALGRYDIDFFSLDVEGAEMGILDTIPWDKLTFTVLAIEHTTKDDLIEYMDKRGYAHFATNDADHIFLNKERGVIKTITEKS